MMPVSELKGDKSINLHASFLCPYINMCAEMQALNASSRAALMMKLDRSGTATRYDNLLS
jgi:endonuclease IV